MDWNELREDDREHKRAVSHWKVNYQPEMLINDSWRIIAGKSGMLPICISIRLIPHIVDSVCVVLRLLLVRFYL